MHVPRLHRLQCEFIQASPASKRRLREECTKLEAPPVMRTRVEE